MGKAYISNLPYRLGFVLAEEKMILNDAGFVDS